jgi:Sec-independent protein translocase protein TatA
VFGLSTEKFVILVIIALFVLGPERLPHYAAQLAKLVKQLRRMVDGAKNQLADEMGDDFNDVDWRKLDPRQYDPRRIIRDALIDEPVRPVAPGPKINSDASLATTTSTATSGSAADLAVAEAGDSAAGSARALNLAPLAIGEAAPFDNEAT